MVSCFCCIKKRGELYLLRNGGEESTHLRNSDENIPQNDVERGELDRQVEREMYQELQGWANELRNRNLATVHAPQAQNVVNSQIESNM